jgi:hypothetical protein
MSTDDTLSEVDDRVRRAVQPDEATIQRVLSRALHETDRPRPSVRWSRTLATIVMIAFLGAGLWRWAFRPTPSPETTTLTITGSRTLVVAERSDGRRWVGTPPANRLATGSYVVVVER